MKCKNNVVFKSIEERDGGSFTNDKGQKIDYGKAFVVRFDEELANGGVAERKVKFPGSNINLYNRFKTLKTYDKIVIDFEVSIQNSSCKLEIVDFSK